MLGGSSLNLGLASGYVVLSPQISQGENWLGVDLGSNKRRGDPHQVRYSGVKPSQVKGMCLSILPSQASLEAPERPPANTHEETLLSYFKDCWWWVVGGPQLECKRADGALQAVWRWQIDV